MTHWGRVTKTDLRDLGWYDQANQGALNQQAARFGLELAQLAYDFEAAPWLSAGWTDLTIQLNHRLFSGVRSTQEAGDWQQLAMNLLLPKLAKGLKGVINPVAEVRQYLQADERRETGKAVVLLRPDGGGRFTVAVGFMGTGRRPQDWAGNMRFRHTAGFHEGFLAVAEQFERNAEKIALPTMAKAMGLESLSLADALGMARQADSPIRIVAAGHSQGAAVLQAWAYRRLCEGVRAEHLLGFGYASPLAAGRQVEVPFRLPLHHFLTSEDVFTRLGFERCLGKRWLLPVDEEFREACYGEAVHSPLFMDLMTLMGQVRNTQDSLVFSLGFLEALSERSARAISTSLAEFLPDALAGLPALAEDWARKALGLATQAFGKYHADAFGVAPDAAQVALMRAQVSGLMDAQGAAAVSRMLAKALHLVHALAGPEPALIDQAPYSYLVVRAFDRLRSLPDEAISP